MSLNILPSLRQPRINPNGWKARPLCGALRLRGQGKVCDLGFVDVDALTGEVFALSGNEITLRQKRARHAVLYDT
jgi:hypothetical protein